MAKSIKKPANEKIPDEARSSPLYARSLLEASLDPLVIINAAGKITDVNKATELVTGCPRKQLIGSDFSDYFTEPEKAKAGYKKVFTNRLIKDYPLEIKCKSKRISVEVSGGSIKDPAGEVVGIALILRDVTGRKDAEKELENLARFPSENPYAVLRITEAGTVIYANPESQRLPKPLRLGVGQAASVTWRKHVAEALAFNRRLDIEENKDGRWFLFKFAPILSEKYVNVYGIEITARKEAEEAIKKQASLIDLSPDAIIVRTLDGEITFWNKGAETLYGWTKKEAVGQTSHKLLKTVFPETLEGIISKVKRHGQWSGELCHKTKDNRAVTVQSRWLAEKNAQGEVRDILESNIDITDRKQMEAKLKENTRNLEGLVEERTKKLEVASSYVRSLIEASLDPLVTISAEGKITDANKAAEEATGFPREQLIGSDFSSYFMDSDKARRGYLQVFSEGFVRDYPLAIRHKSGRIIDVLYNASTYRNEQGKIQGVFAAARDITERKIAEEKYRTLFETIDEGFCIVEMVFDAACKPLDYRFLEVNESFERQTGLRDAKGKLMRTLAPNHEQHWFDTYGKVALTGEPIRFTNEAKALNRYYDVYAFPIGEGKIKNVAILFNDVSERRISEQKLLAASLYSRSLLEASLDPLVTISREGKITDVNMATEVVTGCSRETLIGSDFSDYFTEPQKARAGYQKVFTEGFVKDYPLAIRHRSGRITDVLYNASIYRNPEGAIEGVFAAARDITVRKAMENEIKQTMEKLQQSNSELEQFAYVASHDLQEPLRMVASYVQLIERRYKGKLDKDADEFIGYAVDGANRMRGLIDDLLTYSRVSRLGKPFEPTNLESTLDIALLNLRASIVENKAVVTHDKLPVVMADGGQLVQLLQNLIGNAIKFHGENPPRVHVSAKDKGAEYEFSVRDNGIGIAPEYFDRLFKIFQRLHTREEYPGSGIGLAVCKRIVERHGGRIWIESAKGKGSTVYFTLNKQKEVIKKNEKN